MEPVRGGQEFRDAGVVVLVLVLARVRLAHLAQARGAASVVDAPGAHPGAGVGGKDGPPGGGVHEARHAFRLALLFEHRELAVFHEVGLGRELLGSALLLLLVLICRFHGEGKEWFGTAPRVPSHAQFGAGPVGAGGGG